MDRLRQTYDRSIWDDKFYSLRIFQGVIVLRNSVEIENQHSLHTGAN